MMFAPRLRVSAKLAKLAPAQCLCQQPARGMPKVTACARTVQVRQQSSNSAFQASKVLFRAYPFSVSLAFSIIIFGAGTLMYSNYIYKSYIIGAFHKYPEPVAKQLRKALYYTNISLSPKEAVKYYKAALRVADEVGMDPFSDEILGVKIQVASLMEKIQQYQKAIEVLEIVKSDCLNWVDNFGSKPGNEGKRTRILGKAVGISVKLGELYANEYVMEQEAAEERLVWAVETALKEQQRREVEGIKPDEGPWLSPEELGGSLEALGHRYEEKNQHYLAAPLFLRAIALSPLSSCHTTVLSKHMLQNLELPYANPAVNNLSISLAQQNPPTGLPPVSRSTLISNAREWTEKALAVASKIQPPDRNEECDVGCAVATHNLGEFAEMERDLAEARRRYKEAGSLARAIGFHDGIVNSQAALKRLDNP